MKDEDLTKAAKEVEVYAKQNQLESKVLNVQKQRSYLDKVYQVLDESKLGSLSQAEVFLAVAKQANELRRAVYTNPLAKNQNVSPLVAIGLNNYSDIPGPTIDVSKTDKPKKKQLTETVEAEEIVDPAYCAGKPSSPKPKVDPVDAIQIADYEAELEQAFADEADAEPETADDVWDDPDVAGDDSNDEDEWGEGLSYEDEDLDAENQDKEIDEDLEIRQAMANKPKLNGTRPPVVIPPKEAPAVPGLDFSPSAGYSDW